MVQRQSPLESVGVTGMTRIDVAFWQGKRVLLTGHTGFKGSWLSLWLQSLGAEVVGLALVPPDDTSPVQGGGRCARHAQHRSRYSR
jgi:CDP-glucose 4,6-dehydratase